jgi:hypothetical protein
VVAAALVIACHAWLGRISAEPGVDGNRASATSMRSASPVAEQAIDTTADSR